MKKILLLTISLALICTGCENPIRGRTEIDEIIYSRVLGIDDYEENTLKLIVSTKMTATSQNETQSSPEKSDYIIGKGKGIYEATNNMSTYSDKKIFYGDTEYILISEEAAKKGLENYIDYLIRDNQLRFSAKIYIVKGLTVEALVKAVQDDEHFLDERIGAIENNINTSLNSIPITVVEVANFLGNPTTTLYVPVIEPINIRDEEEESKVKMDIKLQGFMLFQKGIPLGYLDEKETKGLIWLRNKVNSGLLVVQDKQGLNVSLQIINAKTKLIPHIKEKNLSMDVIIDLTTTMTENQSEVKKFTEEYIKLLQESQEAMVKEQVEALLKYAQNHEADMFSASSVFFVKYPYKFNELENNWQDEHFPEIHFNIVVQSRIVRSNLIRQPISAKEER